VNATFGYPGLVPLLIASGLGPVAATRIVRTAPMAVSFTITKSLATSDRLRSIFGWKERVPPRPT
jgi:hypothetical protein